MNKLTIILTGRKQSGKSSTCNYILSKYLNYKYENGDVRYGIDMEGHLVFVTKEGEWGRCENDDEQSALFSFADPLKEFCGKVFRIPEECLYGTEAQKNQKIEHLRWENVPQMLKPYSHYAMPQEPMVKYGSGLCGATYAGSTATLSPAKSGPMTAREVMQIFGTDMVRQLYPDAWAYATFQKIAESKAELALVTDGRFPNEVRLGKTFTRPVEIQYTEDGSITEERPLLVKTIRLLRKVAEDAHPSETALDNFPLDEYDLVLDNTKMTLQEQCAALDPILDEWFEEAGFIA